ncbi:MAG: hypothetical protein ACKN9U_15255 [Pirellulaceae bacterium]
MLEPSDCPVDDQHALAALRTIAPPATPEARIEMPDSATGLTIVFPGTSGLIGLSVKPFQKLSDAVDGRGLNAGITWFFVVSQGDLESWKIFFDGNPVTPCRRALSLSR